MSQFLTCPKGHQWDAAPDGQTPAGNQPLRCPICGAEPETITLPAPTPVTPRTQHAGPAVPTPTPGDNRDTLAAPADEPVEVVPLWPTVAGYDILAEVGRGGMGVVYKARQRNLNRLVALKMVLAGLHAGPGEHARFKSEAEAAARLQHPNIVQIYDVGEQDGQPYLSLEYIDGGSLAQKLAGQPLPPDEAARLTEMLARAIHYAHQRGIVHRDLKPANILLQKSEVRSQKSEGQTDAGAASASDFWLLTSDFCPKITDFGLAKRLDGSLNQTRTGWILGTPAYMAPEQADGKIKQIGPATDVYSLGAILYELLTGRPPFKGETELDTLMQVAGQEPTPPSRVRGGVPRDLEVICLKCLAKDPARRFASARDLADELRRYLDGEPIRTRPMGTWERLRRWARRRREVALVLVGALAAILLGLLLVGLKSFLKAPENPAPRPIPGPVAETGEPPKPLPADLALVPPDALGFISLRPADILKSTGLQRFMDRIAAVDREGAAAVRKTMDDMAQRWGFHLKEVERITFVILKPAALEQSLVYLVTTQKPFDRKKVQRLLGLPVAHPANQPAWPEFMPHQTFNALRVINERTFVLGYRFPAGAGRPALPSPPGGRGSLDEFLNRSPKGPAAKAAGPLREALQRAAGKHLLTAGLAPPRNLLAPLGQALPRDLEPLRPLLALQGATLSLDLESSLLAEAGLDTITAGLFLDFADDRHGRQGQEAVRRALVLLRENLKEGVTELSKTPGMAGQLPTALGLMTQMLDRMEFALRMADVDRRGKEVSVILHLNIDLQKLAETQAKLTREVREMALRVQAANQMKQLVLAMHNYQQQHGRLPPAVVYDKSGRPMHSWRVLLLPYLGEERLYQEFRLNEPWDSAHNARLLQRMPPVYAPAAVAPPDARARSRPAGQTCYQVFTGPDTPFPQPGRNQLKPFTAAGRNLGLYQGRRVIRIPDSFPDGTPNTILVVEAAKLVPWTQPVDLVYRKDRPLPPLGGVFPDGFHAGLADGSVQFIHRGVSEKYLRAAITPAGQEILPLGWYNPPSPPSPPPPAPHPHRSP